MGGELGLDAGAQARDGRGAVALDLELPRQVGMQGLEGLAQRRKERGARIQRHWLNIAWLLSRYRGIDGIVLGGWIRHDELTLLGHLTVQAVQDLRADFVFHGIFGIDQEQGLTGTNIQEVHTDRAVIGMAPQLCILADHSKFGQVGNVRVLPLEAVWTVVTDRAAPEGMIHYLQTRGIAVVQA